MANAQEPFVTLAAICEKVLVEKDGVMTIVRVVDRFMAPPGEDVHIEGHLVLSFNSRTISGKYEFDLSLENTDGSEANTKTHPVFLRGNGAGGAVVIRLKVTLGKRGVYWFNVRSHEGGEMIARTPFTIADLDQQGAGE